MYSIDTTVIINGALVRTLRHRLQMTQAELGLAVGMFQQHISEIERGVSRHVYPTTLARLADALVVEVADLLQEAGSTPKHGEPGRVDEQETC